MKVLSSKAVYSVILAVQDSENKTGTFFSAVNQKKNGEIRVWNCRLGVVKHLQGGKPAYNAEERNFITVWDPNAKTDHKYRQLNVSSLIELKVCGKKLVDNGEPTDLFYEYLADSVTNVFRD